VSFEYIKMSSVEEAEEYFKEKGSWIVANVKQRIGWPEKKVIVYFRNTPLLLIPEETDKYPAIAVLCKNISEEKARETINHFLSSLTWSKGNYISTELWGGGGRPYVYGRGKETRYLSKPFRISYLPDTTDREARLALAFYREAMSLEHVAYSFLSYYKIINLKHRSGEAQKKWIEQKLNKVTYHEGKIRLDQLRPIEGSDAKVAAYLYHSCRCAIAHADINDTTIDPENYSDISRLRSDLPLIRALVEILIEDDFQILSPRSIHGDHPHELFGFKEIIGEKLVKQIKNGDEISEGIPFPDEISIRLWGEKPYQQFEKMKILGIRHEESALIIDAISSNERGGVVFALDFSEERIIFDPLTSLRVMQDDGSIPAVEVRLNHDKFMRRYWLNGILEIWDSKNNRCLGFSDPFIPVNIDMGQTIDNFDTQIKRLEDIAEKRRLNLPSGACEI
jgi:hypothetical protein